RAGVRAWGGFREVGEDRDGVWASPGFGTVRDPGYDHQGGGRSPAGRRGDEADRGADRREGGRQGSPGALLLPDHGRPGDRPGADAWPGGAQEYGEGDRLG